ncbi:MAG: M28 family peptidase [Planctomycetota bacterium]
MRRSGVSVVAAVGIAVGTGLFYSACQGPDATLAPREQTERISQLTSAITAADLRCDVEFIASDACEGRLTGSPGVLRAGRYMAAAFQTAGLGAAPGCDDYFQPFTFAAGVRQVPDGNTLEVLTSSSTEKPASSDKLASSSAEPGPFRIDTDFRPLTFSASGVVEGEIVFAGYALVEPGDGDKTYDSYRYLDAKGKVVLALRDLPEGVSAERRQELSLYAGDRYKAKLAADRGAKAFLLVTGPNSPGGGKLVRFRTDDRTAGVPIPAVSISIEAADRLLSPMGEDTMTLQTSLDGGALSPHVKSATGSRVRLAVALKRVEKTCRNIIGVLPPTGGCDEYVAVGAHYDHIGHGEGMGSLAKAGEQGQIHNGADDNASGTAVVLELAAALAGARRDVDASIPRRGILFACWSGEELGLVGSSHFVNHPLIPLEKIVAYFNFDMVGRLRDNKLIVQGVGSSPAWPEMVERANAAAGFAPVLKADPYLPTDSTGFYTKGVPVLAFFSDLHEDYNRPTDDAETLNYAGMERIAKFARTLIEESQRQGFEIAYAKVEHAAPATGRMQRRTYTGIVPDFASSGENGVRLSAVRPGGPAEQAGLKGGDVIVEFAGKKIASLRDYADALVGAKIGEAVKVVVERDGKTLTLEITPTVRGAE